MTEEQARIIIELLRDIKREVNILVINQGR